MNRFATIISIAVLASSLVVLFVMLFSPQPINITLETGQQVTTQTPDYYSLSEVLLLVVVSFLIGATSVHLFYSAGGNLSARKEPKEEVKDKYDVIHPLLKHDEKRVFSELKRGEVLQNDLVSSTGMSKVAVTRALAKLESKDLIVKERYGLTNKVRLK